MATLKTLIGLMVLNVLVVFVIQWYWVKPTEEKAKQEFYGTPIAEVKQLEGKVFTPQAFVITDQRILVYDKDGKVYSLDGIQIADGMKPEQLTVSEDTRYTVYRKGEKLFFGKL